MGKRSNQTTWNHWNPHTTITKEQCPDFDSLKDLADTFGDIFVTKMEKIRTLFDSEDPEPITISWMPVKDEDMFFSFQPLSVDVNRKIIKLSPNKQ